MSALARARAHLTAARRELEAARSEVPGYDVGTARFLAAEVGAIRERLDRVLRALGDIGPGSVG